MFKIVKSILKSAEKGVVKDPEVKGLESKYPKITNLFKNRFNPNYKYGLYLTIGVVISAISLFLFIGTIQDILARDPLALADARITNLFALFRATGTSKFMLFITYMGKWQAVFLGTSLFAIVLFLLGKRRYCYSLILSVAGGQVLVSILKNIITRQRPPLANAVIMEKSFSFPSGHAFIIFSFYLLAAYILWKLIRGRVRHAMILVLGIALIILIPMSRVYLGVHWASDVLGSVFVGMAWLSVFITYLSIQDRFGKNDMEKTLVKPEAIKIVSILFIIIWAGFLVFYYNTHSYSKVVASKTENIAQTPISTGDIPDKLFSNLPRTSESLTGNPMEPINFIFIGDRGQLDNAFKDAGWFPNDPVNIITTLKIAYTSVLNQPYPTAPGTPDFWDSRPNDFSYEKPTASVRKRQHIHIWATPYTVDGKPLWLATAHFDQGVKLGKNFIPNHVIDPLIDNERDSLKNQLLGTKDIVLVKENKIVDPVIGHNQGGNVFYTDGKGYVVLLK